LKVGSELMTMHEICKQAFVKAIQNVGIDGFKRASFFVRSASYAESQETKKAA